MQVRKQDGTLEAFMPEKVVVSIVKTGAPYEDARSIAASLSNKSDNEMRSSEIRDFVHSQLKSRGHKSSLKNWTEYEREMKESRTESLAGRTSTAQSKHLTHS
ncbi:MAG: ATP cone domain-containing protein [Promethearchaeota archaeon]